MMRSTSSILTCLSTVALASVLGCATFGGGGQVSGVNWALARNGGRVTAFSEDSDYPASAVIDGITSSEKWDKGEGWQAPITESVRARGRQGRRDEQERNWIEIELAQPVTVNNVKVYTIDSEEYPAKDFGVRDLKVQHQFETASKDMIWVDVERHGTGIAEDDGVEGNVDAVVNFRFKPVDTQRIRVLISGTNDLARVEGGRTMAGLIRLTEIEVYGIGKHEGRDELELLFDKQ